MPPFFHEPAPVGENLLDWGDLQTVAGTLAGAALGFTLAFLQHSLQKRRQNRREAIAAAFSCLERIRAFSAKRGKSVTAQELDLLAKDAYQYRERMLRTGRTRKAHSAAYAAVQDVLRGPHTTALAAANSSLSRACGLEPPQS